MNRITQSLLIGLGLLALGAPAAHAQRPSIAALQSRIVALEANNVPNLATYVSVDVTDTYRPVVRVNAANLQVVNGSGSTASVNGKGNIIVGYDEPRTAGTYFCTDGAYGNQTDCANHFESWTSAYKGGSHNVVVGPEHAYSQFGGLVAGRSNVINGQYATVSGGSHNSASGLYSSVSGGYDNGASGDASSVAGGSDNAASGGYSSVIGGQNNVASGAGPTYSTVSGGYQGTASGGYASVSGGQQNTASGLSSSVSGGHGNEASGTDASVSGGNGNRALATGASVIGGFNNTASGNWASVSGGWTNTASADNSSISGGATCNNGTLFNKWAVGNTGGGCSSTHQN